MNKKELKKDVEFLQKKTATRKNTGFWLWFLFMLLSVLGCFVIALFASYLIIVVYLLLGAVSTLFLLANMPETSVLFANMSVSLLGFFILALFGLFLVLLGRVVYNKWKLVNK